MSESDNELRRGVRVCESCQQELSIHSAGSFDDARRSGVRYFYELGSPERGHGPLIHSPERCVQALRSQLDAEREFSARATSPRHEQEDLDLTQKSMLKVYISTASAELSRAEALRDDLQRESIEVLDGWMRSVCASKSAGLTDRDLLPADATRHASDDLHDVHECDAFWLVIPTGRSLGCWIELGYAIGQFSKRRIIVSGDLGASIFCRHPRIDFATNEHDEARAYIVELAR